MNAVCEMAAVDSVRIRIHAAESFSLNVTEELMELQLFHTGGRLLGTIKDLFFGAWNEGKVPTGSGEHESVQFVECPVRFYHSGRWIECDVFAHVTVARTRYGGTLSPEQLAMLKGEGPEVDMPDFESGWTELTPDEEIDSAITLEGIRSH